MFFVLITSNLQIYLYCLRVNMSRFNVVVVGNLLVEKYQTFFWRRYSLLL